MSLNSGIFRLESGQVRGLGDRSPPVDVWGRPLEADTLSLTLYIFGAKL